MKTLSNSGILLVAALGIALRFSSFNLVAADASAPPVTAETATNDLAQQTLRANLWLQDQIRSLQRAFDDYRQQAESNSKRAEEAVTARLNLVEQSLQDKRERELEALRSGNRTVMLVAGAFALTGFLAMLITSWFHLRAVQRVTEMTASLRLGTFPSLALGEGMVPGQGAAALTQQRYLNEVERMQKRIGELEQLAATPAAPAGNGHPNDAEKSPHAAAFAERFDPAQTTAQPRSHTAVLLGKGQTFLNLDQAEKALACFDEVLAREPDHVDTLLKRGAALERLQRFDDAIAVYDRVIGLDGRQTTAYLLKGGICNRLKRFDEALACYDQALKTQPPNKG